jgi:hypothetical protein
VTIVLGGLLLAAGATVSASAFFIGSCGLAADSVGVDATIGNFAVRFVIFEGSIFDFVLGGGFVSGASALTGFGSRSGASIKRTAK